MTDIINNDQIVTETVAVEAPVETVEKKISLAEFLSEEYKSRPAATKFGDVNELFKAYENLESFIGKKVESYSPEDLEVINARRGVPRDSSEYQFPEGVSIAEEAIGQFKELFKKAGLSKQAALDLTHGFVEYESKMRAQQDEYVASMQDKYVEELKKEFGTAYDKRLAVANRAVTTFGTENLVKTLESAGVANHPEVVKFLSNIGQSLSEDKLPTAVKSATFGVTPEDAKNQIQLLMADRESREAYYDKFNPKHDIIKKQVTELYQLAYN